MNRWADGRPWGPAVRRRALPLTLLLVTALAAAAVSAAGATIGPPKPPWPDRPDDRPCVHRERIVKGRHEYAVPFRGTVDGAMTRSPIGYSAFVQGWQPNRSVRIENTGRILVRNPRLVVNGRGDWRSVESIAAEATRGWTGSADRARAIWEFVRRRRFHACTWDAECSDAVKALNVYGYTLCGDQAQVLDQLWRAAGLTTRRGFPVGHVVGEVLYDGGHHLLDSDEHVICLARDNRTIASEQDIVRDHDLLKRTHTYGIGQTGSRQTDEFSASLYGYEGARGAVFPQRGTHRMELVLRPGESLEFRWDHVGKQYTAGQPVAPGQAKHDGQGDLLAGWGQVAHDNLRNGRFCYQPDLSSPVARDGAETMDNAVFDCQGGRIRPQVPERPARVTWRFRSPYVFVGSQASATLAGEGQGTAEWSCSTDGKDWESLPSSSTGIRTAEATNLRISSRGKPCYEFLLRLTLRGPAAVKRVRFEAEVQMAALALPELRVGENRVLYADDSPGEREIRITHEWLERNGWHPPAAPAPAGSPRDGAEVAGTLVEFAWTPPADPDGDAIADYQFELSAHPDMRWPLSPNFEKLVSHTPFRGTARWRVPYAGLLNPDTDYHWHVRARDASGVWGPWSAVSRFRCRAPGVPLDLKLSPDGQGKGWVLSWQPNPQGNRPAAYKVYGSDEQGFTVSDVEYPVFMGKGYVRTMEEYEGKPAGQPDMGLVACPPNLIERVDGMSLRVAGPDLTLPNTNKAFYRVAAVDAAGHASGPSEAVAIPRPWVYTQPPPARAGQAWEYRLGVIRSVGDLRCRPSRKSSYNAAFWDREELSFRAVRLPRGLSLDLVRGVISGVPAEAGEAGIELEIRAQPGRTARVEQGMNILP